MAGEPQWPDEDVTRLRALWADKTKSSAQIGREIGYSKNAVCCKAHRIGLPERESPIKQRQGPPRPPKPQRIARGVSTLAPLASLT